MKRFYSSLSIWHLAQLALCVSAFVFGLQPLSGQALTQFNLAGGSIYFGDGSATRTATDEEGNHISMVFFYGDLIVGDRTLPGPPRSAAGGAEYAVVKQDGFGNIQWSTVLGRAGLVGGSKALKIGPEGDVYVLFGSTAGGGSPVHLYRINGQTGAIDWRFDGPIAFSDNEPHYRSQDIDNLDVAPGTEGRALLLVDLPTRLTPVDGEEDEWEVEDIDYGIGDLTFSSADGPVVLRLSAGGELLSGAPLDAGGSLFVQNNQVTDPSPLLHAGANRFFTLVRYFGDPGIAALPPARPQETGYALALYDWDGGVQWWRALTLPGPNPSNLMIKGVKQADRSLYLTASYDRGEVAGIAHFERWTPGGDVIREVTWQVAPQREGFVLDAVVYPGPADRDYLFFTRGDDSPWVLPGGTLVDEMGMYGFQMDWERNSLTSVLQADFNLGSLSLSIQDGLSIDAWGQLVFSPILIGSDTVEELGMERPPGSTSTATGTLIYHTGDQGPPYFEEAMGNPAARPGETVTFTANARGQPPLRYQWRRNGVELPGETNPTLTLEDVEASDEGYYDLVVRNDLGERTSVAAHLSLLPPAVAVPEVDWVTVLGGMGNDDVRDIATDEEGNVIIVGDVGDGFSIEGQDISGHLFIAKFDPQGNLLWVRSDSVTATYSAQVPFWFSTVETGPGGAIWVTGSFQANNFNEPEWSFLELDPAEARYAEVGFYALFSPGGDLIWSRFVGGSIGRTGIHDLQVRADGSAVVYGTFSAEIEFPASPVTGFGGSTHALPLDSPNAPAHFIMQVDRAGGGIARARVLGGTSGRLVRRGLEDIIAYDGSGDQLLMASAVDEAWDGTWFRLGGGIGTPGPGSHVLFARTPVEGWGLSRSFFSAEEGTELAAVAGDGSLRNGFYFGGHFETRLELGNFFFWTGASGGGFFNPEHAFVGRMEGGRIAWMEAHRSTRTARVDALDSDREGNLYTAGYRADGVDLGNGATLSGNGLYLTAYDSGGSLLWRFDSDIFSFDPRVAAFDHAPAMAGGSEMQRGMYVAAPFWDSSATFGTDTFTSAGDGFNDILLARLRTRHLSSYFSVQPQNRYVPVGGETDISARHVASDGTTTFQWYEGRSGDTSRPIPGATRTLFRTPALTTTTSYWLRATTTLVLSEGDTEVQVRDSATATIEVVPPPSLISQPARVAVPENTGAELAPVVRGAGLSYEWFEGASGETTNRYFERRFSFFITPRIVEPRRFWVRATDFLGQVTDLPEIAVSVAMDPATQTFADWINDPEVGLTAAQRADPDLGETDLDGDGLSVLMEYALGRSPTEPDSDPGYALARNAAGEMVLRFDRVRGSVQYRVEASSDLITWNPLVTDPGNVGETVEVAVPVDRSALFVRLVIVP